MNGSNELDDKLFDDANWEVDDGKLGQAADMLVNQGLIDADDDTIIDKLQPFGFTDNEAMAIWNFINMLRDESGAAVDEAAKANEDKQGEGIDDTASNPVTDEVDIDKDGDGDSDVTIVKQDDGDDTKKKDTPKEKDNSSEEDDKPHEEKLNDNFVITVSKEMINVLDKIITIIENPLHCKDCCIKVKHLYYKTLDDYVISSMLAMSHRKFTHIPIIENNKLIYIFSKASIFNYILDGNVENLKTSLRFKDIINYIDFNEENYLFVKKDELLTNVRNKVLDEYHNNEKVSMIFVTENGKKDGDFIGMFSPIDLLKERG